MSIPAEKGEPPPEDERVRCHRALYRKEVGLIMGILGDFASTKGTDPFSDRNRAYELQEVLEEIDMIWHHCETSTKLVLSESAINVDGALGLLCEFMYRIGRDVTHKVYSYFSESILLIASFLENCVRVNRRAQEKLLNSGLLFGQVALLEIWVPLLDEVDLSQNLILNLSVLHQCFMTSSMSLFYAFFDKDWCRMLKPLTNSTNQEIRMLAKFVASDIHFALSNEEQSIMALTDEDTDFLVCHLAIATASDQLESSCDEFHKPISVMELLIALENLIANSQNCSKLVEQPAIIPTLAALLLSLETRQKTSVCKLLILLVGSPSFEAVWSEDDKMLLVDSLGELKRSQDVALQTLSISLLYLLQKEGCQAFTNSLLEAILKLSTTLSEKLELDPVKGSSSCEPLVIYLNDLLKIMIVLAECMYSEDVLGILSYCNVTGTFEALYHFIAMTFNSIESLNDSVFPCLPLILMLLLRWSSKCKEARCCIMEQGHLNQHTYQLRILSTHENTWFTNFLVRVNLGIILSCVQENQFLASYQDVYWSAVLTPWLKSSQDDMRIATFLIGSCIFCLFEEEDPSMFVLRKEDSEKYIALFIAAAESSHLSTVLCNNLLIVSVKTLLKALKYLFVTHNHLFKSQRAFNAVVTLLLNGGVPEVQAACDFVITLEDWPPLNDMVKNCELPLVEILEQLEESEDCELRTSAQNALNVVQGYSNQEASTTNVCMGLVRDAVKTMQSISRNLKMAEDSQWEQLNQYITQYLSIYLKSDSKAKLTMTDDISTTRSVVRTLCRFVSMLIEYLTTGSGIKRIQLQCLGVIVSGLASWSDWSRKIRCQIQHTPVIVHLINLVSFLSSISDEESSISQLVLTSALVISNCSSEKDFGLLYVPPGTIDWASVLSAWMESPYAPLRFAAKSIAGNIIHGLDDDMLFLLDLTNAEVELLTEMVSQCTVSESLTASGFGCQFHAKELIDLVSSLAVSPHNFSKIILSNALPLSLLQLLRKGGSHVKKSTCRLLLQLSCCSFNIRKEMNVLQAKEALLEEMSEESNDPCFLFLGKCLYLALDNSGTENTARHNCYNFDDIDTFVDIFMEMVDVLVMEISTVLLKFEGRKLHFSAKSSSHIRVMELVEEVNHFWSRCSLSIQEVVTNTLSSNHLQALQVLHKFLFRAMRALGNNEDDLVGPCLVKILLCFQGWAQTSRKLCERILEEGFIFDYVATRFSSMRNNNFENFVVSTMMNIIFHCVQLPAISVYYSAITSSKLLRSFVTSPLQELRVITKCVAGYVAPSLDDQMLSVLHFSEEDAQALVNCFCRATNSDSHLAKFHGGFYKLSLLLIMKAINHLLIQQTEMNTLKRYFVELVDILGANFFQPLVAVMKCGTTSEVIVACRLLWSLLDVENIRVKVQMKSKIVLQQMMEMNQKHCNTQELERLSRCITLTLENSCFKNMENSEAVARGLYLQGRITQCVDVCNKAMQVKSGNDFPVRTLNILQGKALYYKFIKEQRRLQLSTLTVDMKIALKEACYKVNRQVIDLLGKAFDDRLFDDNDETAYMLDRAMMDCVFNANMLSSCHRCYLCRRNLKKIEVVSPTPELSQPEKAGKETSQQEQNVSDLSPPKGNRGKKAEKLIKSHIIPRAILEQLCGSLSRNKQVILSTKSSIRASEDRLLTPAELAYYMLCPKCEDTLSANGETQFSLKFFRKLYSLTDERWAEAEQLIDYGPWLYQFCVGLIFRALHWDVDDYSNGNELYAVFRKCRDSVMGWMHTDERGSVDDLKISLFISPLSVGHYEQQSGYMNMYLRGGIGEFFGHKDASRTSKVQADFFVVRFGVVNIAVEFGDFQFKDNFKRFIIKPSGGTYFVPSEKERRRHIPQCIWSQYQEISHSIRSHLWVADPQISRSIKGEQIRQENPDKVDAFNVGAGIISEGLSNFLKHLSHDDTHDICLLPPEFSLKSTSDSGKITLPKGHTILLHANYVRGEAKGSTFFVAVGSSKKYPINKPYVIWHFYDNQSQSSCGAFFSPEDLSITEFLIGSQTLTMQLLTNSSLATARERMPKILKDLLAEKGFSSMASLLQRVKSAVCVGRDIPPMDTKCSKDRKCWYCRSLCQNCCLKSVAYGRIAPGPHGPNQFCSESCQLLSPGMFSSPQVFIISPTIPPPQGVYIHCDPINQQHREIQHIYIRLLNKQNFPCEMEICLCIGDGTDGCPPNRPYIVFYSHHLFHQLFAEFFISVELLAEEPLPHTANEASWNSILMLNDALAVRKVLEKADVLETTMVQILQLKGKSEPAELFQSSSESNTVSALHQ